MIHLSLDQHGPYLVVALLLGILAICCGIAKAGGELNFYSEPVLGKILQTRNGLAFVVYVALLVLLLSIAASTETDSHAAWFTIPSNNYLVLFVFVLSVSHVNLLCRLIRLATTGQLATSDEFKKKRWKCSVVASLASYAIVAGLCLFELLAPHVLLPISHQRWSTSLLGLCLVSLLFTILTFRPAAVLGTVPGIAIRAVPWILIPLGTTVFTEFTFGPDWYLYSLSAVTYCCIAACGLQVWSELVSPGLAERASSAAPAT